MSQTAVETLSLSAFTGVVGGRVPKIWTQPEQQSHEHPSPVTSSENTQPFVLCKHSGLACSQNLNTTRTTFTWAPITSCLFWKHSQPLHHFIMVKLLPKRSWSRKGRGGSTSIFGYHWPKKRNKCAKTKKKNKEKKKVYLKWLQWVAWWTAHCLLSVSS